MYTLCSFRSGVKYASTTIALMTVASNRQEYRCVSNCKRSVSLPELQLLFLDLDGTLVGPPTEVAGLKHWKEWWDAQQQHKQKAPLLCYNSKYTTTIHRTPLKKA